MGKKKKSLKYRNIPETKLKQKIITTLITLIVILFRLNSFPYFLHNKFNSLNAKVGKTFN